VYSGELQRDRISRDTDTFVLGIFACTTDFCAFLFVLNLFIKTRNIKNANIENRNEIEIKIEINFLESYKKN